MENKMKEYLLDEYCENNHIMNWLKYWLKGKLSKMQDGGNLEDWRKKNDLDCMYFNGNLYADTIISVWTIMKMVLVYVHKDIKSFHFRKTALGIKELLEHFDYYFPKNNQMIEKLEELCEKAELRENFMLLPDREMQIRGVFYADQVPATLFQCFSDGRFAEYFTDISAEEWIKREYLQVAFQNPDRITRDNLKPISDTLSPSQCVKRTSNPKLILDVIEYSLDFLEKRSQAMEQGAD